MTSNYWGLGNESRRDTVRLEMTCKVRGQPVTLLVSTIKPSETMVVHDGCETPQVKMLCDNPRKLGVITSVSE